jgi:glycerophosphoryl diester phosphodiesterase
VLKRAVERYPGIRTQAITCARHADIVGVLRACRAGSVSIELDMFHPDDAKALHDAGYSNRVSLPRSEVLAEYRGRRDDIIPSVVRWIAEGLIDTISGDDVPFLAKLVEDASAAKKGRPVWPRTVAPS